MLETIVIPSFSSYLDKRYVRVEGGMRGIGKEKFREDHGEEEKCK